MRRLSWFLLLACTLPLSSSGSANNGIQVRNLSGRKVEIYWLPPNAEEENLLVTNPPLTDGATELLSATPGHSFLIQEVPPRLSRSQALAREELPSLQWSHQTPRQIVTITANWTLEFESPPATASEKRAQRALQECQNEQPQSKLQDCLASKLATFIEQTREDIAYHTTLHKTHGKQWEDYACEDYELETSPPVRKEEWYYEAEDDWYNVEVLHQHSSSQIHLVEEFIDDVECEAVLRHTENRLQEAKVANGKGGSHFSDHRKALQAGIRVNWALEEQGDLVARLSRRVYDYTNHVLGLEIEEHGQEHLMMIQYFGKGLHSEEHPDHYGPHCDGACNGKPHKWGNRMATMVMYCEVPEVGGHTNFRNAGVHIQPTRGSAVFFSYIDPETRLTDHGFTSHSGCPVYEGSKKIVTQWIRLGVDEDNPYSSFNTLGERVGNSNSEDNDSEEDDDDDDEGGSDEEEEYWEEEGDEEEWLEGEEEDEMDDEHGEEGEGWSLAQEEERDEEEWDEEEEEDEWEDMQEEEEEVEGEEQEQARAYETQQQTDTVLSGDSSKDSSPSSQEVEQTKAKEAQQADSFQSEEIPAEDSLHNPQQPVFVEVEVPVS